MKTLKISLFIVLLPGWMQPLVAQTTGKLSFSCVTYAPAGNWGTKHVAAIWIQNTANPSIFIKTNAKYGYEDDHLTSWIAISNKNVVDAITGATLGNYGTLTIEWDGTDASHTVVPDGNYNIYIEMGWGSNKTTQHAVTSFNFTKSGTTQQLTPGGTTNYSSVNLSWQPTATLVSGPETEGGIGVYPNPSDGAVQINFRKALQEVELTVADLSGKVVYRERPGQLPAGIKTLDLSQVPDGIYLLSVKTKETYFRYKLMIGK